MSDAAKTLNGKVAIVTGGSRGIGAAAVERLAQGGASVVFTYVQAADKANSLVEKVSSSGGTARAVQADAGDIEAGKRLVDDVAKEHGKIDILVNSAAVLEVNDITSVTVEQFDRSMGVNLRGLYFLTQAAVPHMPKGGRIVNIGSIFGESVPYPGIALYSMSKFALNGLTMALARELAPQGITVNCVAPGPIDTDMNPEDGELAKAMLPRAPLGRYGRPIDIAEMVAFLAGPNTDNISGAILRVDGGWNA